MISHDRYTELLSKHINQTISEGESKMVEEFESAQPETCPGCKADVWTFLEPYRVVHDVEKCAGKM